MKLILFLIIIIIIYFIATQIKVVHINTLPNEQKIELNDRSRIRNMLTSNYIKTSDKTAPVPRKKSSDITHLPCPDTDRLENVDVSSTLLLPCPHTGRLENGSDSLPLLLPDATMLLQNIKKYHVNNQYKFNIATLPVTARSPSSSTLHLDKKYIKHITKNINSWNKTLNIPQESINVVKIKPIFITETSNEFIVKANTDILYLKKHIFLQLTYYGYIERSDDPFNQNDYYTLQLVDLKPITRQEYMSEHNIHQPFMSMAEQMEYVSKINKMHDEE